ncbi:MAG: amidohydrolase family protein, partial [Acidobacteriota bacterium]
MDKQAPSRCFLGGPIATFDDASSSEPYGLIEDGAVVVEDGWIRWVGPRNDAPATPDIETVDLDGRLLTPGLIDCHTHLVYGGDRSREFEMRQQGESYEAIARAGGGIVSTVAATRTIDETTLYDTAAKRLAGLLADGVTTVEVKSGYGLDTA